MLTAETVLKRRSMLSTSVGWSMASDVSQATNAATRSGWRSASRSPIIPPSDWPTTVARSMPSRASTAKASPTKSSSENSSGGATERPKQRMSIVRQVYCGVKAGNCCHQVAAFDPAPCRNRIAGPAPWRS
ncbi:hypothetical protein D3C72_1723530 [compost metagenome]